MPSFNVFMVIGMFLMFFCICAANMLSYRFPIWKIAVSAVLLTIIGLIGARSMAWLEVGVWNGRSFYGAVFLVPVMMLPVSKVLKVRYGFLMDICAPAGCIMNALLKIKCKIDDCCYGRIFFTENSGFRFPSQIVECIAAIILMLILIFMVYRRKQEGLIYPWFMILYGIVRFILNLFRETTPWIGPLPSGNFWSLISIAVGVIAIILLNQCEVKQ